MSGPADETARWFEVLDRRRVHDGFLKLDIYRVHQRLFRGGTTPALSRDVVVAHPAVAVICYDPVRDAVVMVEQARLPAALAGFAAVQTEVVAGLIEPGEDPAAVAGREVEEETGLKLVGAPCPIVHIVTTPGHSTETVRIYAARVDASAAGAFAGVEDEHEDIRIVVLPFDELVRRLEDGRVANSFSIIAGYWLMMNRDRLRAEWGA